MLQRFPSRLATGGAGDVKEPGGGPADGGQDGGGGTRIVITLAGDPGHPLSRVKKVKELFFPRNINKISGLSRVWQGKAGLTKDDANGSGWGNCEYFPVGVWG